MKYVALCLSLVAGSLLACSNEARVCTLMAAPVGIGLDIDPAIGPKVTDAKMTICWDGACTTPNLHLMESTAVGSTSTHGDTSSATMVKTGGKNGFAALRDLPAKPVQVTVELTGDETTRFAKQTLDVTPKMLEANGPGCGESGPQTGVIVGADGTARER